jgi:hypothetical protein
MATDPESDEWADGVKTIRIPRHLGIGVGTSRQGSPHCITSIQAGSMIACNGSALVGEFITHIDTISMVFVVSFENYLNCMDSIPMCAILCVAYVCGLLINTVLHQDRGLRDAFIYIVVHMNERRSGDNQNFHVLPWALKAILFSCQHQDNYDDQGVKRVKKYSNSKTLKCTNAQCLGSSLGKALQARHTKNTRSVVKIVSNRSILALFWTFQDDMSHPEYLPA